MTGNMHIWEQVCSAPKDQTKPISGGKLNGKTDINPMWRIRKLTEIFGTCGSGWKVEIAGQGVIPAGDEIVCWVQINLYYKMPGGEEWSAPIPGYGVDMAVEKQKGTARPNDECFKMAFTDAIGSACKMLGFADNIYSSGYAGGYADSKYGKNRGGVSPKQDPPRLDNSPYWQQLRVAGLTIPEACAVNPTAMFRLKDDPNTPQPLREAINAYANRKS